jgi:hypothetical protein
MVFMFVVLDNQPQGYYPNSSNGKIAFCKSCGMSVVILQVSPLVAPELFRQEIPHRHA